ncbi:MAG: hypothetical protein ACRCSN_04780 [Dermatophilaceae bacterium]
MTATNDQEEALLVGNLVLDHLAALLQWEADFTALNERAVKKAERAGLRPVHIDRDCARSTADGDPPWETVVRDYRTGEVVERHEGFVVPWRPEWVEGDLLETEVLDKLPYPECPSLGHLLDNWEATTLDYFPESVREAVRARAGLAPEKTS